MNAPLQIYGSSTASSTQSGLSISTPAGAGDANQPFSVLLGMLDSMFASGVHQTSGQADGSNLQNRIPASALPLSPAAPFSQQPVNSVSTGDTAALQSKTARTHSKASTAYLAAGIPFIAPFQVPGNSRDLSISVSASQSSSVHPSSDILSKIEQEISALMSNGQTTATGGTTLSATAISVQSQQDANGKGATTALQSSGVPEDKAVNPDLLRLISAAVNGNPSNKGLEELSSLGDNLQNGSAGGGLVQKLKDVATSSVARQATDSAHPAAVSIAAGTTSPRPASSLPEFSGAIASTVKAANQNQATQMARDIAVSAGSNNTNTSSVAPATSLVTPNSDVTNASENHAAGQTDGIVLAQVIRADGSQPGRDKQGASGSGDNLSDLLKQGAVQTYAAASDGSKIDTTFKQAMSAATGNSTASAMKPDTAQIAQSIVKQVNLMAQEGKTVVNMKLQPEDLGTVVLKVASQDGKISAEFNVKTPDARTFLETSIPQMRQSLETNGVSLAHLSVSLSTGDSNGNRPQYQAKKQQPKYYSGITTELVESARTFGYNTMELKV
jgi:flagellar hook-length control protein FliK